MVRCRLFYLPREFTCATITAAYIPQDAAAKIAMKKLYTAFSKQQTTHPEAAFFVTRDFNHYNKTVVPKFYQCLSCHTRQHKTLDHVWINIVDVYTATLSYQRQSEHPSLVLMPLKHVKRSTRSIKVWPSGMDSVIQGRLQANIRVSLPPVLPVALTHRSTHT